MINQYNQQHNFSQFPNKNDYNNYSNNINNQFYQTLEQSNYNNFDFNISDIPEDELVNKILALSSGMFDTLIENNIYLSQDNNPNAMENLQNKLSFDAPFTPQCNIYSENSNCYFPSSIQEYSIKTSMPSQIPTPNCDVPYNDDQLDYSFDPFAFNDGWDWLQQQDDHQQYQDISALSKELLVSERKLLEKQNRGEKVFNEYIAKKRIKYGSVIEHARKDYEDISSIYTIGGNGQVYLSKTMDPIGFVTEQELMKVIRQSNLALQDSNGYDTSVNTKSMRERNWSILTGRDREGQLQVINWSGQINIPSYDARFIGQGGFGRVQAVFNLRTGVDDVLKVSCPKNLQHKDYARNDIYNEYTVLSNIHRHEKKIGVQENPYKLFTISSNGETEYGIVGKYCNQGDLTNFLNNNQNLHHKTRLDLAIQLLKGLQTIHEHGYIHGDIKPENCFAGTDENGDYYAELADFGGAVSKDNINNNNIPNGIGTTFTYSYYTQGDETSINNIGNSDDWFAAQKKRDLYAIADTVWQLLTGERPLDQSFGLGIALPHNLYRINELYGSNIGNVLSRSLANNPAERPSINDVINVLEKTFYEG